jgi:hypothetical protein
MADTWELISSERKGQVGRRAVVEKVVRMPDGSEAVFTVTGDASHGPGKLRICLPGRMRPRMARVV